MAGPRVAVAAVTLCPIGTSEVLGTAGPTPTPMTDDPLLRHPRVMTIITGVPMMTTTVGDHPRPTIRVLIGKWLCALQERCLQRLVVSRYSDRGDYYDDRGYSR